MGYFLTEIDNEKKRYKDKWKCEFFWCLDTIIIFWCLKRANIKNKAMFVVRV